MCFKDRDNVAMKNNWFSNEEVHIPTIMLAYCKNTPENNNWCKGQEETDKWLKNHPKYFVYQKTVV